MISEATITFDPQNERTKNLKLRTEKLFKKKGLLNNRNPRLSIITKILL
jgi:hypothetical protein